MKDSTVKLNVRLVDLEGQTRRPRNPFWPRQDQLIRPQVEEISIAILFYKKIYIKRKYHKGSNGRH